MSSHADRTARLIDALGRDLRPVRRLAPPWRRAAFWLAAVAWLGLLLSLFADFATLRARMATPDMWLSQAGAVTTCLLAGWAALRTAIPGSSARWGLLPLPALALWVGASGAGCMRLHGVAGAVPENPMHPALCLEFLLLISLPLAAGLGWMLTRACPLRPGLTTALAGLASAAAAASLLTLIHPFDATTEDLLVHLAAVLCVVILTRVVGVRVLRPRDGRLRP